MPNFAAAEAMLRAQNIALPSLFNRQASQSANLNSLTTTGAGIQGENVSLGLPELVDIKQPQTSTTVRVGKQILIKYFRSFLVKAAPCMWLTMHCYAYNVVYTYVFRNKVRK